MWKGLLHVSELSWKERVSKPQDKLKTGEEVTVKVILVDPAKEKLSLSLKRMGTSPWELARTNHPSGTRLKGPVTHLTPFGAFVMLPEGIEGLVHISDLSWSKKIQHPSEMVTVGQEIEVAVMDVKVDAEKKFSLCLSSTPRRILCLTLRRSVKLIVSGRVIPFEP